MDTNGQHDSKYEVSGPDCQILTFALAPGGQVRTEPGSFLFATPGVKTDVVTNRCGACLTGESCCKSQYYNSNREESYLGVTPSFPAKVIPLDLSVLGTLFAQSGSYMAGVDDVNIGCACDLCGCFKGTGCIVQKIWTQSRGTAFLSAGGTVLEKDLKEGEVIVIDTDAIVAYQDTVSLSYRFAGNCLVCCYGGEGCFNTTASGPGKILIQSMSYRKFKASVAPPPPIKTSDDKDSKDGDNDGS